MLHLRYLVEAGGSDLHLKVPSKPLIRSTASSWRSPTASELNGEATWAASRRCSTTSAKLEEFDDRARGRLRLRDPRLARFRVNAFYQRGSVSLVIRAIPINIRRSRISNLPPVIRDLADEERGIVLLTGTTGSGKSTTLAAMIDHINSTKSRHIVTIEDPIEFLHPDKRSADQPARGRLRHRRRSSARCAASCARTRT